MHHSQEKEEKEEREEREERPLPLRRRPNPVRPRQVCRYVTFANFRAAIQERYTLGL